MVSRDKKTLALLYISCAITYLASCLALSMVIVSFVEAGDVPRESLQYRRTLIRSARAVWGMDAPTATFAAQVHQESRWNPDAVSPVGARGLAQFMPSTSEWISGLYEDLGTNQPRNPAWALRALVKYDKWIYSRVQAHNECDKWAMTLSGYNGGLGWVYKDKKIAQATGLDHYQWWGSVETVNAGRSKAAWHENRGYPERILKRWEALYEKAGWGKGVCE